MCVTKLLYDGLWSCHIWLLCHICHDISSTPVTTLWQKADSSIVANYVEKNTTLKSNDFNATLQYWARCGNVVVMFCIHVCLYCLYDTWAILTGGQKPTGKELSLLHVSRKNVKKGNWNKKKTLSRSTGSNRVCGSSLEDFRVCGGKDLWKRQVLNLEWKTDGVIDGANGDDNELTWVEWRRCKEEWSELSWQNKFASFFQTPGDEYHNVLYM